MITVQIASNINMDSLRYYIPEFEWIESCSYGNYMLDILNQNSILYKAKSEFLILFIDADLFEISEIDAFLNALDTFLQVTNKTVIMNTFCYSPYYIDTFLHHTLEQELQINEKLLQFAEDHKSFLLYDLCKIAKRENIFDFTYWYNARIKLNSKGFKGIANEIKRLIYTYKFGSKKLLILDLDNTLWGGIIGEEEIVLSNDGKGKVYYDFQKNIKKLKDLGILLAICSKNNEEDGLKGLRYPHAVLKEDDFIIKKINWENKAKNVEQILKTLNLGADAAVFIDDNPVERDLIKRMLPEVSVPDFPKNIYHLNEWFILDVVEPYFSKVTLTQEDLQKQMQYKAKLQREELSLQLSYEDFLDTLDIRLKFYINDDRFIERYAQMTQKTNQFNLTTKRYSIKDIQFFIESKRFSVIAVDYQDRFAHEGIIGLAIIKEIDGDTIEIDTFLLSCRVLNRKVENHLMAKIEELYPNKDIIGVYIPTAKNVQVKDFYLRVGFEPIGENRYIKKRR